ncbi:putative G-protein coupled receptor GRL101 [Hypsibius exemplaris]|uniref:G-protein coupled receptor GRL101 n=1 Tax=Hypsibius exemplaris TaxID=2072580 RepID=A0A1W0WCL0_HYPEX|nr:putative G-protein coupled receptor GRL101 [Hypsibius exemplaris]
MSSAEISMMILSFIAVDRFVTIAFGLHKPKCSLAVVRLILLILWIFGVTIAVIPAFQWGDRTHAYYGNNGVCLPLYLQEPHLNGWVYSLVVLIGLNGLMILLIILSYAGIFSSIRKWRQSEKPVGADERQERELMWRFFVLVFVNLCCWIPTFVFKILALSGYKVPDDSYAWIVTFVFPLNGAMNPIVYSLSSAEFRSRVSHVTGCHHIYPFFLRRLHGLQRRLSAPFTSTNGPPSVEIFPPTDVPDHVLELSISPSICSRLRKKCCSAVASPRGSFDIRLGGSPHRVSSVSSRRANSKIRLDIPHAQEIIPLNRLDLDKEPSE